MAGKEIRPSLMLKAFAASLLTFLVAGMAQTAPAAPAAPLDREFRYRPDDFSLHWRGEAVQVDSRLGIHEPTPGRPDLPVMTERIELPEGQRVRSVTVLDVASERIGSRATVLPTRLDGAPAGGEATDSEAPVMVGTQGSMRGTNVAWLLVRPFQWKAATKQLTRISRIKVRIELEPARETEALVRERIVPEWEDATTAVAPVSAIPKGGATPFKPTQLPSVLGSPVAYVIVTNDALAAEFQRLADWKTESGVPAVVRTLTTIRQEYAGTDDADRVRRFLRDAYTRWGTKWALLGGDTDVIPTRVAWTTFYTTPPQVYNDIPTDMYFSCLDGNWNADGDSLYGEGDLSHTTKVDDCDMLPEIYVGRAPVSTALEAHRFVDKVFQYSRTPVGGYEHKVLFFAEMLDPQNWNPGDFIYLDGADMAEECLPSLKTNPAISYTRYYENYLDSSYESGALRETRNAVLTALNAGYNLAVHVGHGFRNVMSVGDSSITNADALALTNGNRLSNVYAIDCTSNAIDFPCIGEALIKSTGGGAVSNIGSTRLDFPNTGRAYQKEFFRLVFEAGVTAVGEAQAKQKVPFAGSAYFDGTHRWTQMTLLLLGDPEMRIWTAAPRTLTVIRPSTLVASDTAFSVHVETAGVPLAGARVTAYKAGDDYASALTDASGNVVLGFRPDNIGTVTLTVTAFNCIPVQTSITLTASPNPLLVEGALTIDDDSSGGTSGNADGLPDAGETIDLTLPIKNNGAISASGVTGVLSTTTPGVTVIAPGVSYGAIAAGSTAAGATRFRFTTQYLTADQTELSFSLSIVDGAGRHFVEPVRITLRAGELRSFSHSVVETIGDGDGAPEPGETVSYVASVRNSGTGVARSVTAILRRLDAFSIVTDSTSTLGNISPAGTLSGDAFTFSVVGSGAKFELRVSNALGLVSTQSIDLVSPASPLSLSGIGHATSVRLAWGPSPDTDLLGYNVYRATVSGGPYVKINAVPTDRTSYYVDEGLSQLTRYFYQVSAVDSSGNESSRSTALSVTTSPPSHTVFPIQMDGNSSSSVAVARITQATQDIVAGAQEHLYVWHADGTAPVDADQSSITSGDFSSVGSGFSAGASIADLDGGAIEIVAPTWNDRRVYVYDTQGQVKPGWPFDTGIEIFSTPAIGDLDKNGTKEILFGSNDARFFVLRSNGTEWMDGDANPATAGVFKTLGFSFNYGTPALADLDHDGFLDIVFSSFDGNLYGWRRDGTNLPGFPIVLGSGSNSSVAIGYLDGVGDTQLEVVASAGGSDDSLYVFEENGARRPGFPVALKTSGGLSKQPSPALADINGDGFLDIVAASTNGKLYVFNRNGTLQPAFTNVRFSSLTDAATESSPVVADMNGDGSPDILIGDDVASLSAFDKNGQYLAGFPIALDGEVKGTPALCDCDGDGKTEIAMAGWDGKLYLWDYDFTFSPMGPPPWPQFHHDAMRTGLAIPETAVAVPPGPTPGQLSLSAPIPNPVRTHATFAYGIPASASGSSFSIDVYDATGRHVRRLSSGKAVSGTFTAQWDLRDDHRDPVASGLYLLVIRAGNERRSHRVIALP